MSYVAKVQAIRREAFAQAWDDWYQSEVQRLIDGTWSCHMALGIMDRLKPYRAEHVSYEAYSQAYRRLGYEGQNGLALLLTSIDPAIN